MTTTTQSLPVHARGIVKRYGDLTAVAGLDLVLEPGHCLGLLGPNGAGKTTTIEILEGLTAPDEGDIRLFGLEWKRDAYAIRSRIGVQLQETLFPDKLTVHEVLRLFASFYADARRPDEVATWVGLEEKRRARIVTLSGGQRQRLALGCALLNRPDVLFLDEPTTGLDPQARRLVWEIIDAFKRDGGAVLLTTHYMDEAEKVADRLVIMDQGRAIAEGAPRAIIESLAAENIVSFRLGSGVAAAQAEARRSLGEGGPNAAKGAEAHRAPAEAASAAKAADFTAIPGVTSAREQDGTFSLTVREAHHTVSALYEKIAASGLVLASLELHRPTLEDVFVSLTGRHLRDE